MTDPIMNLSHGQIMRNFLNLFEDEKEIKFDVDADLRKDYENLRSSFEEEIIFKWNDILRFLKGKPYKEWSNKEKVRIERLFANTRITVSEINEFMKEFKKYAFPLFEQQTNYFNLVKFNHYSSEITNFPDKPKNFVIFLETKTQDWFAPTGMDKLRKIFNMLTQTFEEYNKIYTFLRTYSSSHKDSEYYKIAWKDGTPDGSRDPVLGFRLEPKRPNSPLDYDKIETIDARWVRKYMSRRKKRS